MGSTVLHLLCVMDAEATFFVQKHCIEMCPLYLIGPGSLEWARPPPLPARARPDTHSCWHDYHIPDSPTDLPIATKMCYQCCNMMILV